MLEQVVADFRPTEAIYFDFIHIVCQYYTIFRGVRTHFEHFKWRKSELTLKNEGQLAKILVQYSSVAPLVLKHYINSEPQKNIEFLEQMEEYKKCFEFEEYLSRNWIPKFFRTNRLLENFKNEILYKLQKQTFSNLEFLDASPDLVLINFLKKDHELRILLEKGTEIPLKSFNQHQMLKRSHSNSDEGDEEENQTQPTFKLTFNPVKDTFSLMAHDSKGYVEFYPVVLKKSLNLGSLKDTAANLGQSFGGIGAIGNTPANKNIDSIADLEASHDIFSKSGNNFLEVEQGTNAISRLSTMEIDQFNSTVQVKGNKIFLTVDNLQSELELKMSREIAESVNLK